MPRRGHSIWLAERQGFEPWVPLRVQRFSRPPHSTALASLRLGMQISVFFSMLRYP
jgi:hypothetical protein